MRLRQSEPVVEWDKGKVDLNSCFSSPALSRHTQHPSGTGRPAYVPPSPPLHCTVYCTCPRITDSLYQILAEVFVLIYTHAHRHNRESRQKCGILNYMFGCRHDFILAAKGSPQEKSFTACLTGWEAQFLSCIFGQKQILEEIWAARNEKGSARWEKVGFWKRTIIHNGSQLLS